MCRIRVTAERGANAVELVGGNGGADTAAADQYADVSGAILHGFAHLDCVIRIIVRNGAVVRAEVDQIVASLAKFFDDPFVEGITAMICSNCNAHKTLDRIHMIFRIYKIDPVNLETSCKSCLTIEAAGGRAPIHSQH